MLGSNSFNKLTRSQAHLLTLFNEPIMMTIVIGLGIVILSVFAYIVS